jgi:hypothetical protein
MDVILSITYIRKLRLRKKITLGSWFFLCYRSLNSGPHACYKGDLPLKPCTYPEVIGRYACIRLKNRECANLIRLNILKNI